MALTVGLMACGQKKEVKVISTPPKVAPKRVVKVKKLVDNSTVNTPVKTVIVNKVLPTTGITLSQAYLLGNKADPTEVLYRIG